MNFAEAIAELIGNFLGAFAGALVQAIDNVQWRKTTRLRPVRPLWRRLWARVARDAR